MQIVTWALPETAVLPGAAVAPGTVGPLMILLVAGFVLAFLLGALAHRVGISPPVGYLLAGVLIGPFTPGLVADTAVAAELSEVGVILLMFGVGLHFSFRDLLAVRGIAVPGAVAQIAAATAMGWGLAAALGWGTQAGLVFGLSLSVASTVVLLRALQERRLVEERRGRIAIGWLIVEDLAMVIALVVIPVLAGDGGALVGHLVMTVLKVAAFGVVMAVVGRRVIPWALQWVAGTGSRELFTLGVLAISLGVAFLAAELFQVSFALGAFFAGVILGESDLSHRAAEESLPLRDAFSVLFFVSVGMLVDPAIVLEEPMALVATLAIILVGKSVAAYLLVRLMGLDHATALTISASLAQVGEFSFILAGLGVSLGILPDEARGLILAGAIVSIMLNPAVFGLAMRSIGGGTMQAATGEPAGLEEMSGHCVVVGFGRVGGAIGADLVERGIACVVVDDRERPVAEARDLGIPVVGTNAAASGALAGAGIERAAALFVAIPNGFQAAEVVADALRLNPGIRIVARAHSAAEAEHLRNAGADLTVMAEAEVARGMLAAGDRLVQGGGSSASEGDRS
ncbi:MAG: YbaL family putative K(+) efflux transporter [Candidatus Nanopelagicales bacterium]